MEDLRIIVENFGVLGDKAQMAFIIWCIKDFCIYLICPLTFAIIIKGIYKIVKYCMEN